ncbi:MAG: type IV pilus assembly protein PilM [Bradymonadales bacterium]|nr:type IV pilus assembly protein PilM [Bradymonadales bacterium]
MAKGKNVVGLDIGSSTVKICRIKESSRGRMLSVLDMAALTPEAIVDGSMMDATVVSDTIRELVKRNRVKVKEAAISVAGHSVIIKKIPLPIMTEEELEESIAWEAEQYIPFDINDVYLDVETLVTRPAQGQMDVLLVAAKKEMINDYCAVTRDAGLEPAIVDVDAFCLQNMFEANYGKLTGQTVVLIDIGAAVSSINVLSDGLTTFTRDISMGGNQFTEEIQKQLNIKYEEAEAYKLGQPPSDAQRQIPPQEVERVIMNVSEWLSGEIQRSLDFYAATSADSRIARIYLSGGAANMPMLGRVISRTSGVPVELANPFRNISYDPRQFDERYLESVAAASAVSVGLALRRTVES